MSATRAFRSALLAALAAACAGLFVRVLLTTGLDVSPCGTVPPVHGRLPAGLYAAAAAGAFFLGGLLGAWRTRSASALQAGAGPRAAELAIHSALILFLAALSAALIYETYALASPPVWPITFYIRCANAIDPGWTLLAAAALSGLLGHWLWRPFGPRG